MYHRPREKWIINTWRGGVVRTSNTKKARRCINKHLFSHHDGATAAGTLEERLRHHDDLHWAAHQQGEPLGHTHGPLGDDETEHDLAARYLAEGTPPTNDSE